MKRNTETQEANIIYFTSTYSYDYIDLVQKIDKLKAVQIKVVNNYDSLLTPLPEKCTNYLISDRSSVIFPNSILSKFNISINTHPSLLPLHKGSYALFWSLIMGHPTGTTVHFMDSGIDTGKIISQIYLDITPDHTFKDAYSMYRKNIGVQLLDIIEHMHLGASRKYYPLNFDSTVYGKFADRYWHKKKTSEPIIKLLPDGWNTPVSKAKLILSEYIKDHKISSVE